MIPTKQLLTDYRDVHVMMRNFIGIWSIALFSIAACGETSPTKLKRPGSDPVSQLGFDYLDDPIFRRETLEDSLVNKNNRYSQMRLERYTEEDWGTLPIWNPRVRRVTPSDIGLGIPKVDASWQSLDMPLIWDKESIIALGHTTFTDYPAQLERSMHHVLSTPDGPSTYGLWQTDDWVGGLVWVELPDGPMPALTCATCHASLDENNQLALGRPNYKFNLGRALDDSKRIKSPNSAWGPGRIDIDSDGIFNPALIPDLRPVRYQTHLQRAATIVNSEVALAIRLETNSIGMTRSALRAPREAMWATSLFLFELAEQLPPLPPRSHPGKALFDTHCAGCHVPPGLSGPPVSLETVGTDPAVGNSPYRTTGAYQTPSLRGVSNRKAFTASGEIHSLESLLSPKRAQKGHLYGQQLSPSNRQILLSYLNQL